MRPSPLAAAVAILSMVTLVIALSPLLEASPGAMERILVEHRFRRAILLSLVTASISAGIAVSLATPLSYYISRRRGVLARLVSSLHLLFLGFPPVGLGISLLIALRRLPLVSSLSEELGLLFSVKAIIIAQTTIVAPLAVSLLTNVFSYIPSTIDELAKMYGAGELYKFTRVVLRIAAPGIAGAWVLSFFRALGEFGATLVLAGNTPGYTETLPIAMYNMISLADVGTAASLLLLTVVLGVTLILIYSMLQSVLERRIEPLRL
ncbi:MAG: ABC transporter permease subunit [Desulfurococcales archaeon]|nr:ABC transporter permease subunit [Desulfurococcales archaeon]